MPHPDGWDVIEGKRLRRTWRFPDFASALAFVVEVGKMADEINHHPDIELGWGRATVEWTTHDAGGITEMDDDGAWRTDKIAQHLEIARNSAR